MPVHRSYGGLVQEMKAWSTNWILNWH